MIVTVLEEMPWLTGGILEADAHQICSYVLSLNMFEWKGIKLSAARMDRLTFFPDFALTCDLLENFEKRKLLAESFQL